LGFQAEPNLQARRDPSKPIRRPWWFLLAVVRYFMMRAPNVTTNPAIFGLAAAQLPPAEVVIAESATAAARRGDLSLFLFESCS
jgi:hypothetical protein